MEQHSDIIDQAIFREGLNQVIAMTGNMVVVDEASTARNCSARLIRWTLICDSRDLHDGQKRLTMKTCGWWDIKRWIMSFGIDAEVLAPAKMREEIADEIASLQKKYLAR